MSRPKIEVASYKGRRRPLWLQILDDTSQTIAVRDNQQGMRIS